MPLGRLLPATALALLAVVPSARAAVVDGRFAETEYVSSIHIYAATGLAWAPDGSNRLFITKKGGELQLVKNGAVIPTPVTTVSPIYTGSECGLLGLAFDPDFLANHYLYVFASVSASEQQIIRYTLVGDAVTDKTVVVPGLPTRGANHDGGAIAFGPDGKLYWAIGDNGAGIGTNADLASLASKVGRANRDGTAPLDNPFRDGSGARDFIWARGMRNPFTMAFQPATGLLWLNVVGDMHEQIFIVRKGDHGGYNAQEANQLVPNIRPVIKYRTNASDVINLQPVAMNGAVRKSGVVTFSSLTPHYLLPGEKVTVANVVDSSFNGSFFVQATPSETSFLILQSGPDATSGSGASLATATTANFGGCVTGGAFYDSSQSPEPYRGDFFFADYNNIGMMPGRVIRADLDPFSNGVNAVDLFATDVQGAVDVTLGPDGALYWIGHSSSKIIRGAYQATAQGLVVSPLHLWTAEGQSALVHVSLAMAPAANVTVTVGRAGGDADVAVSAGATLTFTPTTWNIPQTATISAAADGDTTEDLADIAVSATGLTTEMVKVRARDELSTDAGASPPADAGLADVPPGTDLSGEVAVAPDAAAARLDAAADLARDTASPADAAVVTMGDAGVTADAAVSRASDSGCGCQLGGAGERPALALALLALVALLRRRARQW